MRTPERMGIFGLSWQEKVADYMLRDLSGTVHESKMKSFWMPGGRNTSIVNNISREYIAIMATGRRPADFSGSFLSNDSLVLADEIVEKTNIDIEIVKSYLRAIWTLARDGEIPVAKWDPAGYRKSLTTSKTFESESTILDNVQKGSKNIIAFLALAAIPLVLVAVKRSK